eukprot:Skav208533  [mRNA]  locus=scaffold3037:172332:179238:+ [translate_table: standard]
MSEASSNDEDLIEISIRLRDLAITVSGARTATQDFVGELFRRERDRIAAPSQGSTGSAAAASEVASPARAGGSESRAEIYASFGPIPLWILDQSSRLPGARDLAERRVRRAYLAGQWAGAVLAERTPSPNRSEPLNLRSRYYVVLRAEGLDRPACYTSSGSYWRAKQRRGGGALSSPLPPLAINLLDDTTSFTTWSICLARWVLQSRTSFAWHLKRSFSAKWRSPSGTSTAMFPLPAPFPGCFDSSGPGLSRLRLVKIAHRRVLHILVLILDYMYLGRFPTLAELGRHPSSLQRRCFRSLSGFVMACGSRLEEFPVAPGRSGPELIACLDVLERFIDKSGLLDSNYGEIPGRLTRDKRVEIEQKVLHPELQPYRALQVDRLKITGNGEWPLADYLESDLWLPFVEPRCLFHGQDVSQMPVPNFANEDRQEYLKLAKKWDTLGLLRLTDAPLEPGLFCKVFNTYKDFQWDRQIGDRRILNNHECAAGGPSRHLPVGPLLLGFQLPRFSHKLRGSLTDRRDFYSQAAVTQERARSNITPFSFSRQELSGTKALRIYDVSLTAAGCSREAAGDHFEGAATKTSGLCEFLYPCFGALFQGDHIGVEYALEAHSTLLMREGLLRREQRLQGHHPAPLTDLWEGLIIDDYFVLGACRRGLAKENTKVFAHLAMAREAYSKHKLPGSPEKDVQAEDLFKAAGAEIDSRDCVIDAGLCLVGAPLSKRLGLSLLSLRTARLPAITPKLASRLSGSWVSVLLYRRCLSSIVTDFFRLAASVADEAESKLVPLTRKAAEELVLLSCLAPLAVSDLTAETLGQVFATDASLQKGAIVQSEVEQGLERILWLDGDRKGSYTCLDNPARAALKAVDLFDEGDPIEDDYGQPLGVVHPEKPPLFRFDFVEVCGGSGRVSKAMEAYNLVIAPVLDLSLSARYNLEDFRLMEWLVYMLVNKLIASWMLEPPCTTFSAAAHPACRSYAEPLGWNRLLPKVLRGNLLALRSIALLWLCHLYHLPGLLEQPRLSKMAWISQWVWLRTHGCHEAVCASCQFGSPHRKEFRLLTAGLDADEMTVRCGGGHHHIRIEGSYTKASAVYTWELAAHFAKFLARAVKKRACSDDEDISLYPALESILINDILRASARTVRRSWFWRSRAHINVLETSTVTSLLGDLASEAPSTRPVVLLDSSVARGALAKGRSSSTSLQPVLQRAAAFQLAGNLYPAYGHAPTKLNVADDPSRDVELRPPSLRRVSSLLSLEEVRDLHWRRFTRPRANWIRLVILAYVTLPAAASEEPLDFGFPLVSSGLGLVANFLWDLWIFLGVVAVWISLMLACFALLGFPQKGHHQGCSHLVKAISFTLILAVGAPMVPVNSAEHERAERRSRIVLTADRVLRKQTRDNRVRLVETFATWLADEHGITLATLIDRKPLDPEEIVHWLVLFGRDLHSSGKSYARYSETINAIAAMRPSIKRQLTGAWDLAFAWLVDEPHQSHPALPLSILVALMCTALIWGWPDVAAILGLTWAGLLRIGEVTAACRKDLILPSDAAPGVSYILLRIEEPKTRGRGARHQSARVDPSDLVQLISAVFRRHSPSQKLWGYSAQTLRRRFCQLLAAVGLPCRAVNGARPYDLGSLRPGGATHLLNATEDCTLVQRRGRWLSYKVMTIYLQECAVATALQNLEPNVRTKIEDLNSVFPMVLDTALQFLDWCIPSTAWFQLYQGTSAT